ncbi:10953_t:CDS:1, partial [Acaulospora morrowiae]
PARTWFQTEQKKQQSKNVATEQYNSKFESEESIKKRKREEAGESKKPKNKYAGMSRAKRRRMQIKEQDESAANKASTMKAIKSAKKASRPTKISKILPKKPLNELSKKKTGRAKKSGSNAIFDSDLADSTKKKAFSIVSKTIPNKKKSKK